ncbi:cell division protein ZipA [Pseudomonas sp. Snoq117.2]|uniref:cell division protein ZipA n=1 Tax=Pseudomonas sp. Snoq117.2 TaxID=1500302 RepID=UPI0008C192CF|nr:cell division protein ZipA [Pseudomonas sp. Snoq117.2]SEO47225.1 cell division protein ZipA [Pseudomonas sp. Snoq117.2]
MDMGLREWLIIIGVIVIAGILFDGWRRMSGKGKLKFKLDQSLNNQPENEDEDPEIVGPTRVVEPREPSLDDPGEPTPPRSTQRKRREERREEPSADSFDLSSDESLAGLAADSDEVVTRGRDKPRKEKPLSSKAPERESVSEPVSSSGNSQAAMAPVDEVLVINVISRDEKGFSGPALLQNILESGLRFGDMDIFHRHESMSGNGEVLFSMANAVRPGTFDLDAIDDFHTPAVSFFLGLPGPRHPKQAFDLMVAAARKLSSELNGELKDEQRSVMTAQTIEHYRQRIVDFERKSLMLKR